MLTSKKMYTQRQTLDCGNGQKKKIALYRFSYNRHAKAKKA